MAPIYNLWPQALGAWGASVSSGAAAFSLIILFILTITLLALCSRCQKHSFDLDHDVPADKTSTLVRVVQLENVAVAMDNPTAADITQDEKYHSPERTINGDEYIIQRPNTSPVLTEAPDMETSLRSVEQTPPSRTENVLSEDKAFDNPEMSGFQTISLEDEGEQLNHNSSSTLQQPYNSTQHMYETVGQRKDPEGSVSDMLRNPYATYASNNGSNFPAQPPLTETPDGGHNGINITDMYAKVSKTINHSVAPVETPPDVMVEEGAPPLPERS
ncbi:uncharacterized protein si:ch73-204p21.2 isoform X1 [Hoplias malabaricus]|uniref:uncharacterized protein si:ch73-204p21.2 isoform X1 n=1 Tax=Hoplias malabaricus TaxID=27720 RepID=UPI00346231BA